MVKSSPEGVEKPVESGKVELRKGNDRVSILVESITSFRELRSDRETKNFRFELHNGHSFDLVYWLNFYWT